MLSRGDRYGYQIVLDVEAASGNAVTFNHGTLYPILHSLEKKGYIAGRWEEGGSARKRKFYSLTTSGRAFLDRQREGLRSLVEGIMQVLDQQGDHDGPV